MTIGLIGHTALDTVTTLDGDDVERLGGAPLYARRALRSVGVEPVVVTKAPGLPNAIVLPSRGLVRSVLRHHPEGLEQRLDEVGEPFTAAELGALVKRELRDCDWLVLGGQSAADFPPDAIAVLAEAGHLVALDAQGLARGPSPGPVRLRGFEPASVRGVQMLKLNRAEAEALGDDRALETLGVAEVVVTDGAAGARVYANRGWTDIAAGAMMFDDPVGAGDSFVALYAFERSKRVEPGQATRAAMRGVEFLYTR